MANIVHFTKMHGAGNDYIYIDSRLFHIDKPEQAAKRWSHRHTGIGSDGLVLIGTSDIADFSMRIFNADGSEAMMCGNASRCIGKYVYDHGLTYKTELTLETLSGVKHLSLHLGRNERVESVTVDMGAAVEVRTNIELGHQFPFNSVFVSMGNPHLVNFVPDVEAIDLSKVGPELEHHPLFPNRTNVEFAQIITPDEIRMRVWERGSGITQACGTGACATAAAANALGQGASGIDIVMDGGRVTIDWEAHTGHLLMTGPAIEVFQGTISLIS